jgi:tetratricopeptide (TPR) repeat protein
MRARFLSRFPGPFIAALLLALGAMTSAFAQTARWQPDRGNLGLGQASEIQLVFENCSPNGTPTVPRVNGVSLELAGQSQSTEIVNFNVTRRVLLTYVARPTQRGTVDIPPFDIPTDKGNVRVPAASFTVGDATLGNSGATLDSVIQARLNPPAEPVWAGEVFPLTYTLSIVRRFSAQLASNVEWSSAPLSVEDWSKPEMGELNSGGEVRNVATYRTRALARTPGPLALSPAQQLVNVQTGTSAFGLFSRPTMEQFAITTPAAGLTVKALPSPAPADFTGAVGEFTLTSKIVPTTAAPGEPITWTLELAGTGNWPDLGGLPARDASRDFRVVQPQAKRTTKEGTLFEATLTEDVVLIPTQPGTYRLGPVRWSYFDPKAGEYRTLTTETVTVTIAPASAAVAAGSGAAGSSVRETPVVAGATGGPRPGTAPLPRGLPRDPIAGEAAAPRPLSWLTVGGLAAASLLLPLAGWLALAWGRARSTDPRKARRLARAELVATLRALAAKPSPAEQRRLLTAWREQAARALGLGRSVPSAGDLARQANAASANPKAGEADAEAWRSLWTDTDRTLFGPENPPLPNDWVTRAQNATAGVPRARFQLRSLFRRRNLLPWIALLALSAATTTLAPDLRAARDASGAGAVDAAGATRAARVAGAAGAAGTARIAGTAGAPGAASAANAAAQYRAGQFTSAEQAWRARVAAEPTDWIARHNLALALGQQDRWSEALGHATAAFVQNPSDPSVRWHLALCSERAGVTPAGVSGLVDGSLFAQAAVQLSPAEWQRVGIMGAWTIAFALGLFLLHGYRNVRWLRPTAAALSALGLVAAAAGVTGALRYADLGSADAAITWRPTTLRSVPTEAATSQKATPLAAGSVARVTKPFLGWRRLEFTNGQTGWVQASDLIPLWSAPPKPPAPPVRREASAPR